MLSDVPYSDECRTKKYFLDAKRMFPLFRTIVKHCILYFDFVHLEVARQGYACSNLARVVYFLAPPLFISPKSCCLYISCFVYTTIQAIWCRDEFSFLPKPSAIFSVSHTASWKIKCLSTFAKRETNSSQLDSQQNSLKGLASNEKSNIERASRKSPLLLN